MVDRFLSEIHETSNANRIRLQNLSLPTATAQVWQLLEGKKPPAALEALDGDILVALLDKLKGIRSQLTAEFGGFPGGFIDDTAQKYNRPEETDFETQKRNLALLDSQVTPSDAVSLL